MTETLSPSFSEPLPGYDPVDLDDLELRKCAKPLHPITPEVVTSEKDHPCIGWVCDYCGKHGSLLSSCGIVLCVPCWHKNASRSYREIIPVIITAQSRRRHANMRHGLREVELTLKTRSGESLNAGVHRAAEAFQKLKQRRFWKSRVDGSIAKFETTWSMRYFGWHVHLHTLVSGSYIPAGRDVAHPGEANLSDEWHTVTGDSMIVKVRDISEKPTELVRELAKYVAKPVAEDEKSELARLENWPEVRRRDLARALAGGERVRWYCHMHRARKRKKCLEWVTLPGMRARKCDGEYRRENTGFRRLRWTGTLRRIHRELRTKQIEEELTNICPVCGIGHRRAESFWRERERAGDPNASIALALLKSITAHKSGEGERVPEVLGSDLMSSMPAGWTPPPTKKKKLSCLEMTILSILREPPVEDLLRTYEEHGFEDEAEDVVRQLRSRTETVDHLEHITGGSEMFDAALENLCKKNLVHRRGELVWARRD